MQFLSLSIFCFFNRDINKKFSVSLHMFSCTLSNKIDRTISDIVVPPGSRISSTIFFLPVKYFLSNSTWVDLPQKSIPSKVININSHFLFIEFLNDVLQ